mmetsp:Transcript_37947/g.97943  ORF Transcript_37947/g.97943 Transcript_37947/m.97943 type:complete len:230 (-) Transcript_37947:452-1141(-)
MPTSHFLTVRQVRIGKKPREVGNGRVTQVAHAECSSSCSTVFSQPIVCAVSKLVIRQRVDEKKLTRRWERYGANTDLARPFLLLVAFFHLFLPSSATPTAKGTTVEVEQAVILSKGGRDLIEQPAVDADKLIFRFLYQSRHLYFGEGEGRLRCGGGRGSDRSRCRSRVRKGGQQRGKRGRGGRVEQSGVEHDGRYTNRGRAGHAGTDWKVTVDDRREPPHFHPPLFQFE